MIQASSTAVCPSFPSRGRRQVPGSILSCSWAAPDLQAALNFIQGNEADEQQLEGLLLS